MEYDISCLDTIDDLEDAILEAIDENELSLALTYLEDYEDLYGRNFFFCMAKSDIYMAQNQPRLVLPLLDEFENEHSEDYQSILNERRGDAYYAMHLYTKALNFYHKCSIDNDEHFNIPLHFMVGMCYYHLKQYHEAIQYFENVLLDEDNLNATFYCGLCYYDSKPDRFEEYLTKYWEKVDEPDLNVFLDFLNENILTAKELYDCLYFLRELDFISWLTLFSYYFDNTNKILEGIQYFEVIPEDKMTTFDQLVLAELYCDGHQSIKGKQTFQKVFENILDEIDGSYSLFIAHLFCMQRLSLSNRKVTPVLTAYLSLNDPAITDVLLEACFDSEWFLFFRKVAIPYMKNNEDPSLYEIYRNYLFKYYIEKENFDEALKVYDHYLQLGLHDIDPFFRIELLYGAHRYQEILDQYPFGEPDGLHLIRFHMSALAVNDTEMLERILSDVMELEEKNITFPNIEKWHQYVSDVTNIIKGLNERHHE